jgi:hypothetical protein
MAMSASHNVINFSLATQAPIAKEAGLLYGVYIGDDRHEKLAASMMMGLQSNSLIRKNSEINCNPELL